tara:strand:+ start:285 stop:587 length:303 start_codon:yes stop_codon:yes gene_type:complete
MIKKKTKKETPKPVVTDEAKAMLNAATPRKKRVGDTPMTVVAKIQGQDLGKDTLKFIESVSKSSGMSVKDIICCMVRMSRNTGRVNGPRHFAPQLKRFSK